MQMRMSVRIARTGLPESIASSIASSSMRSMSSWPKRSKQALRPSTPSASQAGCALRATSTALVTSSGEASGTCATVAPVDGSSTSLVAPSAAGTNSPPTSMLKSRPRT